MCPSPCPPPGQFRPSTRSSAGVAQGDAGTAGAGGAGGASGGGGGGSEGPGKHRNFHAKTMVNRMRGYCIFREFLFFLFCQYFHEYGLIKAWYPRLAMFLTMTPIIHQLDHFKFRNTIQGFDNGQQHLVSIVKSFGKCFLSIVRLEYRVAPKWYA